MAGINWQHEEESPHLQSLAEIQFNLLKKYQESNAKNDLNDSNVCSNFRVHSMRQQYSKDMLEQFYNEQMIPHFPLEDERDPLEDWIYCLDPESVSTYNDKEKLFPVMDVLLLVCDIHEKNETSSNGVEYSDDTVAGRKLLIFGGVAFEYYQRAEVGLVSYVSVSSSYRKLGVMKFLHPLAIHGLKTIHSETHFYRYGFKPNHDIKVIFAETNTVDAGDASVEEIMSRHKALFALGYRLVEYPYMQPPLGTDQDEFEDVMLLVHKTEGKSPLSDGWIPSTYPHEFIVDFFMSVFPDLNDEYSEHKSDGKDYPFRNQRSYKLSKWFAQTYHRTRIKPDLPWIDVTDKFQEMYDANNLQRKGNKENHKTIVAVVGAGAAGLSAAVRIAKEATSPILVKLIEANDYVGGRIRTVLSSSDASDADREQYVKDETLVGKCKSFAPWPVPLGGEFVHGVDSVVNDLIEQNGWRAEETFDFCSADEYPSKNSFMTRELTTSLSDQKRRSALVKVFGEGKCWNFNNPCHDDVAGHSYGALVRKANELWEEIYTVGESISQGKKFPIPLDMSLSTFIEQNMENSSQQEVDNVKLILDAVYAKTAGSSIDHYGVNEGCREELNWDYTESNFRAEKCFAEIIQKYLEDIDSINTAFGIGVGKGAIELITSTPIVKVEDDGNSNVLLTSREGKEFKCDKVIVAVPLGVLKADVIQFCDQYSLPIEKKLAIEKINFFSGMKAHMLLRKERLYSPSLETTDLFFCPGEIFSQVWVRRDDESIFLTGFVVADGRDQLFAERKKTEQSSEDIFLRQLQRMLPNEIEKDACEAFELYDWSDDEFVRGLYSSPSVDAGWKYLGCKEGKILNTARDDIRAPINHTIFFAGEHANVKTCATVQAAIESGLIAASDVLESIDR